MSALARLVARATGQAANGLTPRLPSRFEAAPGDPAAPVKAVATEQTSTSLRFAPAPEAPESPPRPAPVDPRSPDPGQRGAAPDRPEHVAASHSGRSRPPDTTLPPAPAGPLLRETPRPAPPLHHAASPPDALASRPAPPAEQAPQTLQHGDLATSAPPEPLLPPAPPRAMPAPQHARAADRPAAPAMTRLATATPAPQPPEITVHIGRLHVVTEPREGRVSRATAERPAPRANTLSDYLRGKGGAS